MVSGNKLCQFYQQWHLDLMINEKEYFFNHQSEWFQLKISTIMNNLLPRRQNGNVQATARMGTSSSFSWTNVFQTAINALETILNKYGNEDRP